MSVHKEADLFITINHKQKSVSKSLLVSLLADIRLGDSDAHTALTALCSAVVRALNVDKTSALSRRFVLPGVPPDPSQNLTISEAVNGLRRSGLVGKVVGAIVGPGPLTASTDAQTVERASAVLNSYFERLRAAHPIRWEAGRDAYVSTNPAIRAHLSILSEVITYIQNRDSVDMGLLTPDEISASVNAFCEPMFLYFGSALDQEIKARFSRKFGEGGVREYIYELTRILNEKNEDFGGEEFRRWVTQSNSEKIDEYNQFLMKLAERLTDFVIDTLKRVHGTHRLDSDEQAFWELGVESDRIRRNAFEAQQRDTNRRRPKEAYLNIVDLAEIVKQPNNWPHFEFVFKNPMGGERSGQKYYLGWISVFNELRNIAAHKNQLKTYKEEDLEFIEWLRTEVSPKVPL
jgi:hypothetical protein